MNDTKTMGLRTMGLRLPVQAAVDRTAPDATLVDGAGVEASQNHVGAPVRVGASAGTRPVSGNPLSQFPPLPPSWQIIGGGPGPVCVPGPDGHCFLPTIG
jgi:hypothetical protein